MKTPLRHTGFIMEKYDKNLEFPKQNFHKSIQYWILRKLIQQFKVYNTSQPDRHDSYVSRNFITCKENQKILTDAPVVTKK